MDTFSAQNPAGGGPGPLWLEECAEEMAYKAHKQVERDRREVAVREEADKSSALPEIRAAQQHPTNSQRTLEVTGPHGHPLQIILELGHDISLGACSKIGNG